MYVSSPTVLEPPAKPAARTAPGSVRRLKALDLYARPEGAGIGIHHAGLEVTGMDSELQPEYPLSFQQRDPLTADLSAYHLVWAAPPLHLIAEMREKLKAWGGTWVLENGDGGPQESHVLLCGSMFGLDRRCHHLFESNLPLCQPRCHHGLHSDVATAWDLSLTTVYAEYLVRQILRHHYFWILKRHSTQSHTSQRHTIAA